MAAQVEIYRYTNTKTTETYKESLQMTVGEIFSHCEPHFSARAKNNTSRAGNAWASDSQG